MRPSCQTRAGPQGSPLPQVKTPLGTHEDHAPPPGPGEHTLKVLREAGIDEDEIEQLRRTDAVG